MSVRDSHGNELQDGDSVQVIKDLKLKGSSTTLKRGRTFKNIRLTSRADEVECREGKTTIVLRTEFLKKV
jgi:protein PhnA